MPERFENNNMKEVVEKALLISLGLPVDWMERMKTGLCNEVFAVFCGGRKLIVRLNVDGKFMKGSEKYIPLFRSKGIAVPELLASDYSKIDTPYCYQVLSYMQGDDLGKVIESLDEEALKKVAQEVATIFKKLAEIPTDGSFGCVEGQDHAPYERWMGTIEEIMETAIERGRKTGILSMPIVSQMQELVRSNTGYLDSVASTFYYDDIASKNVMVHQGRLSGLVDLDSAAFGDPLEAVGRIKTSFHNSVKGKIYIEAVQNALSLDEDARRQVTFYAALHKFSWMYENGIQFNQNTQAVVDQEKLLRDQQGLKTLLEELEAS